MNKRYLFPLSCAVIAAVLTALLLWPEQEKAPAVRPTRPGTVQTAPTAPVQTRPAAPAETTGPVQTLPSEPQQTEPAEPEQTVPAWTEPEQTFPVWTEPESTEPPVYDTIPFPVELEGGMLTVRSIFTYSGMNPDADWAFGENIAGIQLTNTSDEYLRRAEITAVLADGTVLTFLAEELPPGKTVMAFSQEHQLLADPDSCEDIYGDAEFIAGDAAASGLVQLEVAGTEITLKNVSGRDLNDLNVICHGLLDDSCFGGTAYRYTIPSLRAGESTVIHAADCLLGMAEVVRVELDA